MTQANALNIQTAGIVVFDGTATFSADTVTQFNTLVGGASNTITSIATGTSGQVLISGGAASNPAYNSIGTNSGLTAHGVLLAEGNSAFVATAVGATNTVLLGNTGADPSFGAVPNAALVNSSISLANGNNITVTGSPVSLGGTATINVSGTTNHSLLIGNASGSINNLGVAGNGAIPIGSSGSDPVVTTLTAGAGITITNGAGSITVAVSGSGTTWIDEAVNFNALSNTGYFVTAVATVTLPASPAQGDIIRIVSDTASVVTITANTGQRIRLGNTLSALAGTAASTKIGDAMDLVFRNADSTWYNFTAPQGAWNVT